LGILGQWEHDGGIFLTNFMTLSSDPTRQYFGWQYSIFIFSAKIPVFRALDRVSSVSGSKVIPKIFQIFQEYPRAVRGFPQL